MNKGSAGIKCVYQIVEYEIQEQENGKSAAANIKILQEAPEEAKDN